MVSKRSLAVTVGAAALAAWLSPTVVAAQTVQYRFNIPAQDLGDALRAVAVASNQQIVFSEEEVRGLRSPAVVGERSVDQALDALLGNSRLAWSRSSRGVIIVRRADGARTDAVADEATVVPELLVQGTRSLNADVRRTEDDILPYVVFSRDDIQRSQAVNIEDFLATRLPMVTDRGMGSRNDPGLSTSGTRSSINLRGLGANQTLILINGRRSASVQSAPGADPSQPDINGIPIAAIERIEVLPGSASGIYGGGATGGVINIILRKDYSGTELQLTYDNSFDTDSARRRIDLNTGVSLEEGRTQIMLSGSYSDGNDLLATDRDFIDAGRQRAFQNLPEWFIRNANIASNRTNFRRNAGPLTLKNGTPFGSYYGSVPAGYAGGDAGAGLLAGAGSLDLSIPDGPTGQRASLSAVPENKAVNLTIRRDMTDNIQAYLDLSGTWSESVTRQGYRISTVSLAAGQVGNPFQQAVAVTLADPNLDTETVTKSSTERVNGGLIIDLSHGWTAGLDANWNRATNEYDSDLRTIDTFAVRSAVTAGQIDLFRDLDLYPIDLTPYLRQQSVGLPQSPTDMQEYTARVAGPLFSLPAGQVRMTGLLSRRQEDSPDFLIPLGGDDYQYYYARKQTVDSVYAEVVVPIFSETQKVPLMYALETQFSARWDHYETTSSPEVYFTGIGTPKPPAAEVTNDLEATDYTIGLKYMPFADLTFRASYATGFLPPSLSQLLAFPSDSVMYLADPLRDNTSSFTPTTFTFGGNPDAKPEESTTESFGLIYTPSFLSGLRISVDHVRIEKTDELTTLSLQEILDNEASFPGRVIRGGSLPGDLPGWAGVVTAIDGSLVNVASSRLEATDIQVDYEREIGDFGQFRFYVVGTIQSKMERQITSASPMVDRVGFSDGPGELRFNFGVDWRRGPLTLSFNTQYYDEYKVFGSTDDASLQEFYSLIQGSSTIPSQTYTDIAGRYVFDDGWMEGTQISVGIRNLFNEKPPIIATGELSGGYSTFGDPRLRTYSISIRKAF